MDFGVGAMVFSGGLVAGPRMKADKLDAWAKLVKSIKTLIPVLILGFGRMMIIKALNYQVGVKFKFLVGKRQCT